MQRDLLAEARSALAQHGVEGGTIEVLSPPSFGRKRERCTLRIRLVNGSVLKVRCLESAAEAARLTALRGQVDAAYAPVLARYGSVLLEPWIEGETLSPALAEARAADVGALLGRLHATGLPEGRERVPTQERYERAVRQLSLLVEAGVVSSDLSQTLRVELRRGDPGDAARTVVHTDYCPENLVVDASGGLHVIDNEWLHLDAAGVDLGRTYARWPMPDRVWRDFLRGYATTATFDSGALHFWRIVMAAASATVRLRKSPADLAVPLARLRQLATSVPES